MKHLVCTKLRIFIHFSKIQIKKKKKNTFWKVAIDVSNTNQFSDLNMVSSGTK